jgi:hypothetical protein
VTVPVSTLRTCGRTCGVATGGDGASAMSYPVQRLSPPPPPHVHACASDPCGACVMMAGVAREGCWLLRGHLGEHPFPMTCQCRLLGTGLPRCCCRACCPCRCCQTGSGPAANDTRRHSSYQEKNMVSWPDRLVWLDHAIYLGMWCQGFTVETPQATQNTAKRMYASYLRSNRARNQQSQKHCQQLEPTEGHQHTAPAPT